MDKISYVLSGIICPVFLVIFGVYFGIRLKFFYILHPVKTLFGAGKAVRKGFSSLACALAGTLGVGNIAGVATALYMGGSGALVWMEIGALCAMSVKYIEVRLAMETRVKTGGGYVGGAWYYIRKISPFAASAFAVLCIGNSLLTGNIVQVKAAAEAVKIPPIIVGAVMGAAALWVAAGGGKRIRDVCTFFIPVLCFIYLGVSLYIIVSHSKIVPQIAMDMIKNAFSLKSAGGGLAGFGVSRCVRYGICRGIFSNEAGCGTSPTAHVATECEDVHGQSCLGILEVFIDTTVLCTVTGFVILISGERGPDGIGTALRAFSALAGDVAGKIIAVSVVLFAFSTVICQASYGLSAVSYLSRGKVGETVYLFAILISCLVGSVIGEGIMWEIADILVSLMTVINIWYLLRLYGKR